MIQFDDHIFSDRLKTPTSDVFFLGVGELSRHPKETHTRRRGVTCVFFSWMDAEGFCFACFLLVTCNYTELHALES